MRKKTFIHWFILTTFILGNTSFGETLDSTNYKIKDATIGGNGITQSTTFALLSGLDPTSDSRLTSSSYRLNSGFPNGIIANVPKVTCFETTTTSGNTTCLNFPNTNGAQGECGYAGCYDKAKLEIDIQNNPLDTLFLVKVLNVSTSVTYYLQSNHTLSTTYDLSSFMDKCDIEGKDSANSSCNDSLDLRWNLGLQKFNIFGLTPNTQYSISIAAMNGDFSGTSFGPNVTATTAQSTLSLDLDIGPQSSPTIDTINPYTISLNNISASTATTAQNLIWIDMATNATNGINLYIKDQYNGLYSAARNVTIPSESENLATDPNGNGGFGVKIYNYSPSQSALGPLLKNAQYNTAGTDQIGAFTTSPTLLYYTENSTNNVGPIVNARGAIYLKARNAITTPTGNYIDNINFTLIANL